MANTKLLEFTTISRITFYITILVLYGLTAPAFSKDREIILQQENEAVEFSKNWQSDSINKAILQFEQTALDWKNYGDNQKAVFCFNETAKLAQTTSDYKTAFRVLDAAIKLATENNLTSEKAISISLFAIISRQKGDTDNSKKYSEEALLLSERTDSSIAKGFSYLSAGIHEFYFGKIEKTKELFEKADSYAQQTTDVGLIVQVLINKGYTLGRDGDGLKGLNSMQLALQRSEEANYKRGIGLSYFGIGFLNMLLNEKQKAYVFFQKAEEIFPDDFEWMERAKLYSNFGAICEDFGEFDLAEAYREKAFNFYRKAAYPFGELVILWNLARIKFLKGNFSEARTTYQQTINLAFQNKSDFYVALSKEGIADLELNSGNYDQSIKYYQEALKVYEQIGIKLPRLQNNLGKAYEKKGEFSAAKAFYTQALNINNETKDRLPSSENLFNLAKLNFLQGNVETSFEQINKSLEITESIYSDVLNSNLKRSYFSNVYDRYEFLINLLLQKHKESPQNGFALQALQVSERSRSRSMLENLRFSKTNFIKDANPEIISRENEVRNLLNQNADKLTELLSRKASEAEINKIEKEIYELENELENIKARLKQESPVYSTIKNPPAFEITQFQNNVLDDNSVLLEFSLGEKESYLWVVSNVETSLFVLPPKKAIENRIEKIHQTFEARQFISNEEPDIRNTRIEDSEKFFDQESSALSKELLGEAYEKLQNKRLIIVPDGKLSILPLAALPIPDSNELLISRHEIVYQPSASFLSIITKIHNSKKIPNKDVLIFADPVFSDIDTRFLAKKKEKPQIPSILGLNLRDFRLFDANGKIPRLFATQDEADSIAETVGKSKTTIISGFAANRDRVLAPEIKDFRIIHFATHGLVDIERPEVSSIVLSLFDENGEKQEGFLRLQDIYALDLNSDLVVLSACQTGVGKEIKGEGLMSLNNAFLQAGVKTVISSAWRVDDTATAELMRKFYFNLINKRLNPSESLRLAQLEMSKSTQFKSPFYWAAFTIQGEFRQPISTTPNYSFYIFSIIILIFCGGLFWYWRKRSLN